MAAIIEWKDQLKQNQPFIFGVAKIKGRLLFTDPSTGNPKIRNESDVAGSVVVITRGGNTFAQKYANAACLGASLVLVANTNDTAPNSVFTCTGDIGKSGLELPDFNSNYPPCFMISLAAYRRLRLETPFMLTVTPMQSSHISRIQPHDFGAAIRANTMLGKESLIRELVAELNQRENCDKAAILNEGEVGRGATACHVAVECKQPSCLTVLLKAGADFEVAKSDGYTALHLAAINNDVESAMLLIEAGAYLDHPHPTGWTALHLACKYGAMDVLHVLVEAGADANAKALDGSTALHVACLHGIEAAVMHLIRAGADATLETIDGLTAVTFALYCGHPVCAASIEKHAQIGKVRKKEQERRRSVQTPRGSITGGSSSSGSGGGGAFNFEATDGGDAETSLAAAAAAAANTDDDHGWSSYGDNYGTTKISGRRGSGNNGNGGGGGGLLDEEIQMEDVFSSSSGEQIGAVNISRRGLQRKPSIRSSFTGASNGSIGGAAAAAVAEVGSKYGMGAKWRTSLDKLCVYCQSEQQVYANDVVAANADAEGLMAQRSRSGSQNSGVDLVDGDLSRCCFIPYRSGFRRTLLRTLLQMVLDGEVSPLDESDAFSVQASAGWRGLAGRKVLVYKQGLLSLLAPIVEVWFTFPEELDDETSQKASSNSVEETRLTEDDMLLLRQCSDTFFSLLYCFPGLTTYLGSTGSVDSFQPVFDAAMRSLNFWLPNISTCLAWRSFAPALFAVPWATTLMADVLSLPDVQYLWSRLFEIADEMITASSSANTSDVVTEQKHGLSFGDRLLSCLVAASVLQLSSTIDPVNNHPSTKGESSSNGNNNSSNGGCKFLPTQEELLMLFSSINNDTFHQSLFESKQQHQQLVGTGGASATTSKRLDIGEIARSTAWFLKRTPRAVLNGTDEAAATPGSYQHTVWSVLSDIPHLQLSEIVEFCVKQSLSAIVIDVNGSICGQTVTETSSVVDTVVNRVNSELESKKAAAGAQGGGTSTVLVAQQLRARGMLNYFKTLARDLSGEGQQQRAAGQQLAGPPATMPRPPNALRFLLKPSVGDWRVLLGESAAGPSSARSGSGVTPRSPLSSVSEETADPSSAPSSARDKANNLSDSVVVLVQGSGAGMDVVKDLGALLVTCGIRNVAILSPEV